MKEEWEDIREAAKRIIPPVMYDDGSPKSSRELGRDYELMVTRGYSKKEETRNGQNKKELDKMLAKK